MFKAIANFFLSRLSSQVVVDLIKAQIAKNAPKLSDEQKQELLTVATSLVQAAAAGAVSGAVNK
jgi:hypothetical protein